MEEATCSAVCTLRLLNEATVRASVQHGVTPQELRDEMRATIHQLDKPGGYIAEGHTLNKEEAAQAVRSGQVVEADQVSATWEAVTSCMWSELSLHAFTGSYECLTGDEADTPPAAVLRALGTCILLKAEGVCANTRDPALGAEFGAVVPVDRDLGAGVLETIARDGTLEEVRAYMRMIEAAYGNQLPGGAAPELSEDDARTFLAGMASILRSGAMRFTRRDLQAQDGTN